MTQNNNNKLSGRPGLKRHVNSLQGRYLIAAAILSLVVLGMCISSLGYLEHTSEESRSQLITRNNMEHIARQLYKSAWDAEYHLLNYALLPGSEHQTNFLATIDNTLKLTRKLEQLADIGLNQNRPILEQMNSNFALPILELLRSNIGQLRNESMIFMDLRQNPNKLFPSMEIMVNTMSVANTSFYQAASMVIEDLDFSPDINRYHYTKLFRNLRHNWSLMIGSFRVYVANRLGTFGDPEIGLQSQSHNVEMHFAAVQEQIKELTEIAGNRDIGLLGKDSLDNMKIDADKWFKAYLEVKTILASDHWRLDIPMLRDNIRPLFENTRTSLMKLSELLEQSASLNIELVGSTAEQISLYQVFSALIMLIGIAIGYVYLRNSILKPVKELSAALLTAGKGSSSFNLSTPQTNETRTLVNAFNHMHSEINKRQQALQYQATHDTLTGLANRFLLHSTINDHIRNSVEHDKPLALLLIDLNRFKEINDSLGHDAGDKVLLCTAERIRSHLREADLAVRLGGDEFAILLPGSNAQQAREVAGKIQQLLSKEMIIDNQTLYVGNSIGIALAPEHAETREMLMHFADIAMYKAKKNRTDIEIFSPNLLTDDNNHLGMSSDLHKAIQQSGLEINYQPKIRLSNNSVCCIEALLRWDHPERGLVPPHDIIRMAEQNGQIRQLTDWILNYALAEHQKLLRHHPHLILAINLSVWDLMDPELPDNILCLLEKHQVSGNRIVLEVTESAMMHDPRIAEANLERLHAAGLHTAIDDFGTGFASLAYLKHLPLDELKLDKTFITDMEKSRNDAIIVESTIELAHKLGMQVTAEGVESEQAIRQLVKMGCDQVQGFHICKPLAIDELRSWLDANGGTDQRSRADQRQCR